MNKLYIKESKKWLKSKYVSKEYKDIIKNSDEDKLKDMFAYQLEFGTAGLRGVMGVGTNRMNEFVVRKATIGVGLYVLKYFPNNKNIAISFDNRFRSKEFANLTCSILNDMGINTYIFDEPHPTPELSFAVRHYKCASGIMITASHNPKEYNGYKVYDEHGGQMVFQSIDRLLNIISSFGNDIYVKYKPSKVKGINKIVDEELDPIFLEKESSVSFLDDLLGEHLESKKTKIVFSPQCGTNCYLGPKVLRNNNYQVEVPYEQAFFDPFFSGTLSPNPEEEDAYVSCIELLKKLNKKPENKENKFNLILTCDPDADRVGCAFLNKDNEVTLFTGNQLGALLVDFVLKYYKKIGKLNEKSYLFESFVTSNFGSRIAKNYGVNVETVLTGFKYIGNKIANLGADKEYVFGYEESYGYLMFPFVRDKDSLQSMVIVADMVEYYLRQGKTLDVVFDELQQEYGYYQTKTFPIVEKDLDKFSNMKKKIYNLIDQNVTTIGGLKILAIYDYNRQIVKDFENNQITRFDNLPRTNCVKYILDNNSWVAIRPSGTEPKIKIYIESVTSEKYDDDSNVIAIFEDVRNLVS